MSNTYIILKEKNLIHFTRENGYTYILDLNTTRISSSKTKDLKRYPFSSTDVFNIQKSELSLFEQFLLTLSKIYGLSRTTAETLNFEMGILLQKMERYLNFIESNFNKHIDNTKCLHTLFHPSYHIQAIVEDLSKNEELFFKNSSSIINFLKTQDEEVFYALICKPSLLLKKGLIFNSTLYKEVFEMNYNKRYMSYWGTNIQKFAYELCSYVFDMDKIKRDFFLYFFIDQKFMQIMNPHDVYSLVNKYLAACRLLNIKPKKTSNGMRELVEVLKAADDFKEYNSSELWQTIYTNAAEKLNFETDKFQILLPKEPRDLVEEGAKMHHCVGSYINKVQEGECYIVFIRKKENLEKPYITAQIKPSGEIGQYYLAYDRCISSKEDKEFKAAYAKHLAECWNE